jgi:hypothetical protein
MPLSFFKIHEEPLRKGAKVVTRRAWTNTAFIKSQKRTLARKLFARVWCGGKGKLIGYALYHDITQQRLGDMTLADVKAEGYEGMSVDAFKRAHLKEATDDDVLWVVHFTFMPLC